MHLRGVWCEEEKRLLPPPHKKGHYVEGFGDLCISLLGNLVSNFLNKDWLDGRISLQFYVNLCLKTLHWQFLFCMFT